MPRVRTLMVTALAVSLGMALPSSTEAQPRGPGAMRPDVLRTIRSASDLIRLVAIEKVQKELKLGEEELAKLKEVGEKIRAGMREQYGSLREIDNEEQRSEKVAELAEEFSRKTREKLSEVLSREQLIRLYQIRLQVRGALEGLSNRYVAGRLKLSEETKKKLGALQEEVDGKTRKLFEGLGDLSREQRREKMGQLFEKSRKLQADADERALKLLTDEEREGFESIKGEKFELDPSELRMRRR